MISEVDAQLGRVWKAVRAHGAWDDTIVILTSDHAEMMGDHLMLGKGGFFDGSYHIPLIVRDPRLPQAAGRKVDAFTEAVDILPTTLDLIGATVPAPSRRPLARSRSSTADADGLARRRALGVRLPLDRRTARPRTHFGIGSRQCNLAVIRDETLQIRAFRRRPAAGAVRSRTRSRTRRATSPSDPAYRVARLEMAERLLAWRAEHLDQSLALSAS